MYDTMYLYTIFFIFNDLMTMDVDDDSDDCVCVGQVWIECYCQSTVNVNQSETVSE